MANTEIHSVSIRQTLLYDLVSHNKNNDFITTENLLKL